MLLCAVDQQRHLATDACLHAYKCKLHLFTALMLPDLRAVMLKISNLNLFRLKLGHGFIPHS